MTITDHQNNSYNQFSHSFKDYEKGYIPFWYKSDVYKNGELAISEHKILFLNPTFNVDEIYNFLISFWNSVGDSYRIRGLDIWYVYTPIGRFDHESN